MGKTKPKVTVTGSSTPLKQPLSGLAALRDQLPPGPQTAPAPGTEAAPPPSAGHATTGVYTRTRKIVVRRERKGHGGKTVTRVEGLAGSADELEAVTRELKRRLGCGATLDGADVLVHGDQSDRVAAFLQSQGASHIVRGT